MTITQFNIPILTILFYIPVNELFLTCLHCSGDKLHESLEEIKCWEGRHLLSALVSIIGIILFVLNIFMRIKSDSIDDYKFQILASPNTMIAAAAIATRFLFDFLGVA